VQHRLRFVKALGRRSEAEPLAWSPVELLRDGITLLLTKVGHARPFRQVLTDEPKHAPNNGMHPTANNVALILETPCLMRWVRGGLCRALDCWCDIALCFMNARPWRVAERHGRNVAGRGRRSICGGRRWRMAWRASEVAPHGPGGAGWAKDDPQSNKRMHPTADTPALKFLPTGGHVMPSVMSPLHTRRILLVVGTLERTSDKYPAFIEM
jgi:hypothetical protein